MRYAVILAGGSGTRLWPLSRRNRPKQLLRLFGGKSLLRLSADRLLAPHAGDAGLFAPERTLVVTSAAYVDQVRAELPEIPPANFIGEPIGRDTANAIGLAAHLVARREPGATLGVFTADHMIGPQDAFAAAVQRGLALADARPEALVTFGITPNEPHTGYGYIRRGARVAEGVHRAAEFTEKPALATAIQYVQSGEYVWNSGMFAWSIPAILGALTRHLPANSERLSSIAADWGSARATADFAALPPISIDFGVLERASDVYVVDMNCDWLDLGSWTAFAECRAPDGSGNAILAHRARVVQGSRNIVVSEGDHLIMLLGINDAVVVHSPDATLVCHREAVQSIRELSELRREAYGEAYE